MMRKRNRHSKPNQRASDSQIDDLVIGDCIVAKPGIKDPDFGTDIGGWQGRVTEIQSYDSGEIMVMVQWDSLSLKCQQASRIRRSEEKGLDWTMMGLGLEDIKRAEPRDTQDDVDALIKKLSTEHTWDFWENKANGFTRFWVKLMRITTWRRLKPGRSIWKRT